MTLSEQVSALEKRAGDAGLRVDDLCRSAGINRATWQRWKAGTSSPTMRKWQAVMDVVAAHEAGEAAA